MQTKTLSNKLDVLDPYEYVLMQYENARQKSSNPIGFFDKYGHPYEYYIYQGDAGTDWQDEVFGTHPVAKYVDLSLNGGTQKTKYKFTFVHQDQPSVMVGNGLKQNNLNVTLNTKLYDFLTFEFRSRLLHKEVDGSGTEGVSLQSALRQAPTEGLDEYMEVPEDNTYFDPDQLDEVTRFNPIEESEKNYRKRITKSLNTMGAVTWEIIKGMTFRSEFGFENNSYEDRRFWGIGTSNARNNNNQPDELAWFMPPEAKFPEGSVAYITTYWLGDDEIVQPSVSAFTGASTLEKLVAQFSTRSPFCLSYVSHVGATPYGVLFDRPVKRGSRRAKLENGTFLLVAVNSRSIFCEPVEQGRKESGTWNITRIQGTRVLELHPNSSVESSDLGIQPVNQSSIGVGFAEVMRPGARSTKLSVVPVRIIRNNMPVIDFRLKFNPAAGEAIKTVLAQADAARTAYKAQDKARIKAELEAGRRQPQNQQPIDSAKPVQVPSGSFQKSSSPQSSTPDPMGEFLRSR